MFQDLKFFDDMHPRSQKCQIIKQIARAHVRDWWNYRGIYNYATVVGQFWSGSGLLSHVHAVAGACIFGWSLGAIARVWSSPSYLQWNCVVLGVVKWKNIIHLDLYLASRQNYAFTFVLYVFMSTP